MKILTLNKKNITDFAAERNNLLKNTKNEWIFFLDKDEKLSPELSRDLKKFSRNKHTIYKGYYVKRKNYFLGKYVGIDKAIRLGKKDSGKWYRIVHEAWKINGKVGELNGFIIHNTADSVYQMIAKVNRYSSMHAVANIQDRKKSSMLKIIIFPILKFFQSMSEGKGVILGVLLSFHSFLAWTKQWEQSKK